MEYCNVTTNLTDVYPKIDQYQEKQILAADWTKATGQTNTYQQEGTGQVNMVFDDGIQLTSRASVALTESNAGSFYYDSNVDVLYIHTFGSDDMTGSTIPIIEIGEDWDSWKSGIRYNAQEIVDAYLNKLYPTPLSPRLIKTHSGNDYEYPVVLITALLTCALIIQRRDPRNKDADALFRRVINPDPEPDEVKGLINQLLDGDMVLQEQISKREVGGFNVYPYASNSGTGYIKVSGQYIGARKERWRLQIDTAGAPGTATYKISYDGSSFDLTLQETFNEDNDERRIHVANGIYVEFYGTFVEDDYWDIEVFPLSDQPDLRRFSSIEMVR